MIRSLHRRLRGLALAAPLGAMALGGCTATRTASQPDSFGLGRNAAGEPCRATRTWSDAAAPDAFATAYFITCRNVAASRPLGAIRIVEASDAGMKPVEAALDCGPEVAIAVAGSAGTARRCLDRVLATDIVRIDIAAGRTRIVAGAAQSLLGPLEEGIAIVTGRKSADGDPGRTTQATIDLAALPAGPAAVASASDGSAFDANVALAQGIGLNHKGLHTDASRVLNDALSRLPADASAATRAELLLEAALADSNISFAESARGHFDQADLLIAQAPEARSLFLRRKRDAYHALDELNRREFRTALASLDRLVSGQVAVDQPLMDLSIVRRLNQSVARSTDAASAIAVPNTAELSQVVLDAQANWARSVALSAIGDEAGAMAALDASAKAYETLQGERIDQAQVLWLGARIERQRGRLAARRKDWPLALASFDRALDFLRRGAIATAGTGNEPAIAETQLERAAFFADSGADPVAVRAGYASAVDALIASNISGSVLSNGIDGYLDLLVAEAASAPQGDTYERFFRAMQAAGEPAVARQLSQLQNVVTADPSLGAKVRDRAEAEREITRLRYAIANAAQTPDVSASDLEAQRRAAEAKLLAIDASLSSDQRFRSIDDRPATIADIRAALQPGEAYLKIAQLSRRAYGLFVSADQTFIYRIAGSQKAVADLDKLGRDVRTSIDGQLDQGKLVQFDTGSAYVLFRLIAGPASDAMIKAQALVIDPAGPLDTLPIAALVTSFDPKAPPVGLDFSRVAFLGAKTTISTAVSPRSFLVARSLPASGASFAFLGLGEHVVPTAAGDARPISVGFGCSVPYEALATLSRQIGSISKRELTVAANALGDPQAPMMTDAAFSDTAIAARSDLGNYQILHFATHGLTEGQWGCAKSPPALVTSFGDADSDGLLSFSEIARLRLNANLVVLSACDTASGVKDEALARASGQEEAGSTLEGLVRAFLTANARAVMATYWQVSAEQESEDFIRIFYTSARTASIGTALQSAQRSLIARPEFSHPFYWAPYFIVGDSTKPLLSIAPRPPVVAAR